MDENTSSPQPVPSSDSNRTMLLIALFIVIVLAVLGGVYIMNKSKSSDKTAQITPPTPTQAAMMDNTENMTTSTTPGASPSGSQVMKDDKDSKTFNVVGSNFKFNPTTITVSKGDTVKIVFTSQNGMHDFVVDEFSGHTKVIGSGETDTISFVANKAGTYEYYCSVGNHRQMGMVGKLIVQ